MEYRIFLMRSLFGSINRLQKSTYSVVLLNFLGYKIPALGTLIYRNQMAGLARPRKQFRENVLITKK